MSDALNKALPALKGAQKAASDPEAHVWLSASAGTGKTQVLAARVFRLLLRGVEPGAIQCLTFTKAGAAEMAGRVNDRLARWVRMPKAALQQDLLALGERVTPLLVERARTLFAKVLDAPGGGLRIQTIHGFCQSLLAAFPVEAGLTPGFRPLEAREESILMREALAAMLADAEQEGRQRPERVIGDLSMRLGEGGAEGFLYACARALPALEELPSGVQPWLRRQLDLPIGDIGEAMAHGCGRIDLDAVQRLVAANRAWGTATGTKHADTAERWLAAAPTGRVESLAELLSVVFTGTGTPRKPGKKMLDHEPDYELLAQTLGTHCADLLSMVDRAAYADLLADGLEIGRDYARSYAAAKRRAGAVDFDDLIQTVVRLFGQPGIGEWVRYKLDQVTEHVLIDEAQDTNAHQWAIVGALAEEFFQGRGQWLPSTRTLFTVGDYKQAIFGFQGTDPREFADAARHFVTLAHGALGDDSWPVHERGLPMHALSLVQSFRSTAPILSFVDAAIGKIPEPGLGIDDVEPHRTEVAGAGRVELWPPEQDGNDADGEEGWLDERTRKLATRIAKAVRGWLHDPCVLKRDGMRLEAQDVMILVKRRGELASLLVARLHAEGVPVAGVDRLRLTAPLAVQDLLAAIRFVLQPEDDLSLASLLVSPLIGWSQDQLMAAAVRPEKVSLWRHLQGSQSPDALAPLSAMLARADVATPYQLLEEMLSGPLDGRRRLLERLGAEARDPIEELLNAALTFESTTTPSLQRFLDWFDRGEVEIVRDPSAPLDAVRVMTAHGAKGLQAPLVILADACVDPTQAPRSVVGWRYDDALPPVPVFRPRKAERGGALDAALLAVEQRELEEHWRLFYVAATRAEERLVIAGALGPRANGAPYGQSWYAAAAGAMDALGVPAGEGVRVYAQGENVSAALPAQAGTVAPLPLPDWALASAPAEARPARPLSPSALGDDAVADPPPTPALRAAAERGRLMHALFERLPGVAIEARRGAADRWLCDTGGVADAGARGEIIAAVLAVIDAPAVAEMFAADVLAEAPLTAVVGDGMVVAGTVDRLLVTPTRVRVVDFKTGRRTPGSLDEVPDFHLKQMAAYAAALAVLFPGRAVEAALLYTRGPTLFELPPDLLARHKPGLAGAEQS